METGEINLETKQCAEIELCDGIDNDCDGELTPEEQDQDGDGYVTCDFDEWLGSSEVIGDSDCDDSNPLIFPTSDEIPADGVDGNCDGQELCYTDKDGDGFAGGELTAIDGVDCEGSLLFSNSEDCDDQDSEVNPSLDEIWYDGIDQNCDGLSDFDQDADGQDSSDYGGLDCEDQDSTIYSSDTLEEGISDGIDQNCDGFEDCYVDADEDGFGSEVVFSTVDWSCTSTGLSQVDTDCNDSQSNVFPGANEICDGLANNCPNPIDSTEVDQDGDGYVACDIDSNGWEGDPLVIDGGDCDDTNPSTYPGAYEVWYDGYDQNCDGLSDYDQDGDGYEYDLYGGTDCSDTDPSIYLGAPEFWYDGINSDCGSGSDYDYDGDGSDSIIYGGTDCDDANATVFFGATEIWYDGIDSNCDGLSDFDQDADGFTSTAYGGPDCDDIDGLINPSVSEIWYDGVDSNCDGLNDFDQDGDGFFPQVYGGSDCNDLEALINPNATEINGDFVDQNCDGIVNTFLSVGDLFPGELRFSEFHLYTGNTSNDEWVEIYNPTIYQIDLQGLEIDANFDSAIISQSLIIEPNDRVVLLANANLFYWLHNLLWTVPTYEIGFGFDISNEYVSLIANGTTITSISIPSIPTGNNYIGVSYVPMDLSLVSTEDIYWWCISQSPYGSGWYPRVGTPGTPNDVCDADGDLDFWDSDCDETDSSIYSLATEYWYDGVDQNCDGWSDYDSDYDGYDSDLYGGNDCDDTNGYVNPGETEIVGDGVDQNCDGFDTNTIPGPVD